MCKRISNLSTVVLILITASIIVSQDFIPLHVTGAQVPGQTRYDQDGDGVPDNVDQCKFVSGRGSQYGGVDGANGCPVDSDRDGVVDGLDPCPFAAGTGGNPCPQQNIPAAPIQPPTIQPPTAIPIVRPSLPQDGTCALRTGGTSRVNQRQSPTTGSKIVGVIEPTKIYYPVESSDEADGTWYRLSDGGWVAGFVVDVTRACRTLSVPTPAPSPTRRPQPTPTQKPQDVTAFSWEDLGRPPLSEAFAQCSMLISQIDMLPVFLTNALVDSGDPCGDALAMLEQLVFEDGVTLMMPISITVSMVDACPSLLGAFSQYAERLAKVDKVAANRLLQRVANNGDACGIAQTLLGNIVPAELADLLDPVVSATANCGFSRESAQRVTSQYAPAYRAGSTDTLIDCSDLRIMDALGQLSETEERLVNHLDFQCNMPATSKDVLTMPSIILIAHVLNVNIEAVINDSHLCDDPIGALERNLIEAEITPQSMYIPPQLSMCPWLASLLARNNERYSPAELYSILNSVSPCNSAWLVLMYDIPVNAPFENLACGVPVTNDILVSIEFVYNAATVQDILVGGQVINAATSWATKASITQQNISSICDSIPASPIISSPQADNSQDTGGSTQNMATDKQLARTTTEAFSMAPDTADNVLYGLLENATVPLDDLSAVFQVTDESDADIYAIRNGEITPIIEDETAEEMLPSLSADGNRLAYIVTDADGTRSLIVMELTTMFAIPRLTDNSMFTVDTYRPAWSPSGDALLVTLVNNAGEQGVYRLSVGVGQSKALPELIAENASGPAFSSNGNFIAYERDGTVYAQNTARPEHAVPLFDHQEDVVCASPAFDFSPTTIYFVCRGNLSEQTVYRYGLQGVETLAFEQEEFGALAPGPSDGLIALDDSEIIYFGIVDVPEGITPLVRLESAAVGNLSWPAPALANADS